MKLRFRSLIATAAMAAVTFLVPAADTASGAGIDRADVLPNAPVGRSAVTASCGRPMTLRLIRFEDGSAQVRCGRRILLRISVPG